MDEKSEISTTMKVVFAFVAGVLITGGLALVTLRRHEAPPKTDVPQQSAMAAPSAPASSAPPVSPSIASPSPEPPQNVEPPAVPKPAPAKPRPSAFSKASAPAKTIATVAAAPLPQNPSGASSGDPAPDNAASAGSAQASQVGSAPATQVASAQQLPDLPAPQPVQNPPGQQAIYGAPQPPPQQPVNATPAPNVAPPPHTVTIAAGTNLVVRLAEELSSSRNTAGDAFRATLDQPVVLDGFIIADKGSAVRGKVVESQKAGHMTGKSELGLELTEINTTDGQTVYVRTSDVTRQGPNSTGENAAKVGGGAALGAIIGALAAGGKGAAIGAGAGGAAGTGVMLSTRGKPTKLPVETRLTFQLNEPVSITEQIRH